MRADDTVAGQVVIMPCMCAVQRAPKDDLTIKMIVTKSRCGEHTEGTYIQVNPGLPVTMA